MNFRCSRALPPRGARSRRDERHSAAGPDHLICPGRAGPLIWLGRAGDACVVGALERVGDTLSVLGFTSNFAAVLRTLMPPARAARCRPALTRSCPFFRHRNKTTYNL